MKTKSSCQFISYQWATKEEYKVYSDKINYEMEKNEYYKQNLEQSIRTK